MVCKLYLCYNFPMKTCSRCSKEKPESDYFVKDKKSGRLHAQCKACYKEHRRTYAAEHYLKYGDQYRERANGYRLMVRQEFRENMIKYLKDKTCIMCDESDMRTFEFDHLDPATKLFNISQAVRQGYRWPAVVMEIKKCRILCANCHKKHTATQFGWYKDLEARTGTAPV